VSTLLHVEQIIVPFLPAYFAVRYYVYLWGKRRVAESWGLLGSNVVFTLVLLLGASSVVWGAGWAGREYIRVLVYASVLVVFGMQIIWLETRLRHPDLRQERYYEPEPQGSKTSDEGARHE
jgi:cytochrome c biogenesis protein CcdA